MSMSGVFDLVQECFPEKWPLNQDHRSSELEEGPQCRLVSTLIKSAV